VEINPAVTTSQGDTVVLSKCRYAIKNKRGLISLLDSSRQFVRVENEGKRTIRFDWVQKINKKDPIGTMTDSMGLDEHLSLNTILWMSSPNHTGDKDHGKDFISKINDKRDDVDKEPFTAYRVLSSLRRLKNL
jgi:hypothetical protein